MRAPIVAVAVCLLVAVPLAGCVGQGSGDSQTAPTSNGSTGNATAETNGTDQPAARPHVHDRWQDPTSSSNEQIDEILLVDRTLPLEPYRVSGLSTRPIQMERCEKHRNGPAGPKPCFGWAEFRPGDWSNGDPKIVPPGTSRLDVTVSFAADDFDGIDFFYKDRNSTGQWEWLTDAGHGGPFQPDDTKSLDVSVYMSDDGHAQVSSWRFAIQPAGDPILGEGGLVTFGSGEVRVRVVAHRTEGELPFEPPHPDFWSEDDPPTDVYRIGQLDGTTEQFLQAGPVDWEPTGGDPVGGPKVGVEGLVWEIPVGFEGRRITDPDYPAKLDGELAAALIPPGSESLTVQLAVSDASTDAPASDVRICVLGQDTPGEGFPRGPRDRTLVGEECRPFSDGTYVLQEALQDDDTDSFYTNTSRGISTSRWTIYVQIVASETAEEVHGVAGWSGRVSADVYVSDDAGFEPAEGPSS